MKHLISIAAVYLGFSLFAGATGVRPEGWSLEWWIYIASIVILVFGIEGVASSKYDEKKGMR